MSFKNFTARIITFMKCQICSLTERRVFPDSAVICVNFFLVLFGMVFVDPARGPTGQEERQALL